MISKWVFVLDEIIIKSGDNLFKASLILIKAGIFFLLNNFIVLYFLSTMPINLNLLLEVIFLKWLIFFFEF